MIAAAALLAAAVAAAPPPAARSVSAPGFRTVRVHPPPSAPSRVVLLLSGAGGLDAGSAALAHALAARGALAVEIDAPGYLAGRPAARCAYPAGDLEELAQRIEKVQGLAAYLRPILVGTSRGAVVAWAALSQAPGGTFAGAVAVGACPDHAIPLRLCAGSGPSPRRVAGGELPALVRPPGPIEVVSGAEDGTCPPGAAERFASAIGARFTRVPGAAHGLSPALLDAALAAVERLPSPAPSVPPAALAPAAGAPDVSDLPVVEVPSSKPGTRLAVLLSGDGGWVGIDKALSATFAAEGVPVAGIDSLRYFWKRRTPEETARDVARVLAHYRAAFGRDRTILVGYSRGADIVPLVASRLPPEERAHLALVAMLGPSTFAELEVHAIDLFSSVKRKGALPTEDAVRESGGAVRMLCVHGAEEHDSLCPRIADLPFVKDVLLAGGHHFDGGYDALARMVLDAAP